MVVVVVVVAIRTLSIVHQCYWVFTSRLILSLESVHVRMRARVRVCIHNGMDRTGTLLKRS